MENILKKDKDLLVLSSTVTNATRCYVTEIDENNFEVETYTEENYFEGEEVTFFTTAGSGVIYFTSQLNSVSGKSLNVKIPETHTVIQRREYTRVAVDINILLKDGNRSIRSTIKDISAGGMRIVTNEKLESRKGYRADIHLEKNLFVSCIFKPIRIDLKTDKTYNVSGRFTLIKNIDRVALVQYCFKKEKESENRNK